MKSHLIWKVQGFGLISRCQLADLTAVQYNQPVPPSAISICVQPFIMFQQRGKCWCHAGGKGSRLSFTGLRADNMMISLFSHGRTGWRRCKNILQRKAGGEGYCTGTYLYVFVYLCLYIHMCVFTLYTHTYTIYGDQWLSMSETFETLIQELSH